MADCLNAHPAPADRPQPLPASVAEGGAGGATDVDLPEAGAAPIARNFSAPRVAAVVLQQRRRPSTSPKQQSLAPAVAPLRHGDAGLGDRRDTRTDDCELFFELGYCQYVVVVWSRSKARLFVVLLVLVLCDKRSMAGADCNAHRRLALTVAGSLPIMQINVM